MRVFVPELDDPDFLILENKINADFEAIKVKTDIDYNQNELDCFNIVKEKVENEGGGIILGWQIWKSDILIEAEAHAVWENLNKELIDISPKQQGIKVNEILFVEDSSLGYNGRQIENIKLNITDNAVVDHFIQLAKKFFYLQNKGERAKYHDLSEILKDDEIKEIESLIRLKNRIEVFILEGNTEKSLCFCNNGKIYKNCHGKDFFKNKKKRRFWTLIN